jgi:hypothetical protein
MRHDPAACPRRPDGADGTRPCTWWDHDPKLTVYADDRDPADSCQAGTPGCSVDHTASGRGVSCQTW